MLNTPLPAATVSHSFGGARNAPDPHRAVALWLLVCCAMVFGMIVVGGATRLTHSGLSITEWQPIVGTLPPLSLDDWNTAFDKYKQTPEFKQVNHAMSLEEFKGIFWWEYAHRLLGRTIGMVFLLPLLWFIWRKSVSGALTLKLGGIFILGGLQGAMGWYMVKSGLVDDPRVSQFRLTAHLSLAFVIYAAQLWVALGLLYPKRNDEAAADPGLRRFAWIIVGIICYMIVTGGFVAGIRAGFAYNTFPLMNGHFIPPEIFMLEPWWKNFFYNMATVQFDHRLGAWVLAAVVPWFWLRATASTLSPRARLASHLLLAMLVVQIVLGIATLLLRVPVSLGATHQAGAVLLFSFSLMTAHALRR